MYAVWLATLLIASPDCQPVREVPLAPSATASPVKPVYVEISAQGEITVNGQPADLKNLAGRVRATVQSPNPYEERIYLRPSDEVPYGQFRKVQAALNDAGFLHIAYVSKDD